MSSINSPLGRLKLAQQPHAPQQPQQRVLSVPDESADEHFAPRNPYAQGAIPTHLQPQMPAPQHLHPSLQQPMSYVDEIKDMRRERIATQNRPSQDAIDRINYLAGIGRKTVDVELEGSVFTLKTLKGKEVNYILKSAKRFPEDSPDNYHTLRNLTLSYCIVSIDGISLHEIVGDSNPEMVAAYVVAEMENVLVDYLWNSFLKLQNEQKEKYSIKDSNDLKEVVEDIKK